ncbi:MAG TPA: response regulator [Deltaproteobacteria bacterium]|nr:response regulator [Deltaproteobacteria bacterium]
METVLVIDDDRLVREMARDMLVDAGYRVFTAAGAEEGLAVVGDEKVDAVLVDVVMPGQSGLELIPRINALRPATAVMVITAYATVDKAVEAIRAGAYDFIRKPLREPELLHSVRRAMERCRLVNENARLVRKLADRVRTLELFEKIAVTISSTLELDTLLEEIMELTKTVMGAEACSILLHDEATGELAFTVALGEKGDEVKEVRIRTDQGIAGWVFSRCEPLLIEDASKDSRFFTGVDEKTGFATRSIIAVPLVAKERIIGVIEVINKTAGPCFTETDRDILVTLAGQIAIAIDNATMTEELKRAKEQLEEYSRNLEGMVSRRTAELEAANREIRETQSQLLQAEKLSSIGQLAAGIAHEINNPIGFINSNLCTLREYIADMLSLLDEYDDVVSGLAEKGLCDDAPIRKARERMKFDFVREDIETLVAESIEGAYRIYKIVRDMKTFSRADNSERGMLDVNAAIDTTLNILWNEIKYRAEVVKEYGDVPEIECLPMQLNQVFMNILMNAAQAINGRGEIRIKTYAEGPGVVVEISDTGSGIAPEKLDRIFDPFYTTKPPGKGTGLGLSISYGIIKKHGGAIEVDSAPGRGTTFRIRLPGKPAGAEGTA